MRWLGLLCARDVCHQTGAGLALVNNGKHRAANTNLMSLGITQDGAHSRQLQKTFVKDLFVFFFSPVVTFGVKTLQYLQRMNQQG